MRKLISAAMVIFVWLGVTYYFVTLHTVHTREAAIGQTITLDGVTLEFDSLILYNAERPPKDPWRETSLKYNILTKIPWELAKFYLRLDYLYSKPFIINNEYWHTALVGKCIFREKPTESREFVDYFYDHLQIELVDSVGTVYTRNINSHWDDNGREMDFVSWGENFPLERLKAGFTIKARDKLSGEEREFRIEYHDFAAKKYNDAFGRTDPVWSQLDL
ncbi:MAG TPA: hypothetical protein GXX46_05855 [Peptococcaceae bacterium]|nr:hypothetical protein [Peptococcaceae bacterium]